MRGEHDAHLLVGHDLHQALEELASGQRVQARHRLVEQEQLRPLGDRQQSGRAGLAGHRRATRPAGAGRGRAARPGARRQRGSQVGLSMRPSAGAWPPTGRRRRACPGPRSRPGRVGRAVAGAATEHADRARRRRQQPDGEVQQRGLAGAVGTDQPDDPARGNGQVQSVSAQRRPYRFPSPSASTTDRRLDAVSALRQRRCETPCGRWPRCRRDQAPPSAPAQPLAHRGEEPGLGGGVGAGEGARRRMCPSRAEPGPGPRARGPGRP